MTKFKKIKIYTGYACFRCGDCPAVSGWTRSWSGGSSLDISSLGAAYIRYRSDSGLGNFTFSSSKCGKNEILLYKIKCIQGLVYG